MFRRIVSAAFALAAMDAATAQTTVTLYGIADGDFRMDRTAIGTLRTVGSGGEASSRWGLRGTEDLGGGLKAVFNFEQDFDLSDNSAPQGVVAGVTPNSPVSTAGSSRLFGRRAIVGLNSATFGELRIGREYTPLYQAWATADPFGAGFVGRATNIAVGSVTRNDNSITYETISYAGIVAKAQVRLGESSTNSPASGSTRNGGFSQGYSLAYATGPVYVAVGYLATKSAIDVSPTSNTVRSATADATYDFGFLRVAALYWNTKNQTTTRQRAYALGVTVPLQAFKVLGTVGRVDNRYNLNNSTLKFNDANYYALGVTYALSKRFDLYTAWAKIVNQGNAQFLIGDNSNNGAFTTANVPAGFNPSSLQAGMRFLF